MQTTTLTVKKFDRQLLAMLKYKATSEATSLQDWTIRALQRAVGLEPERIPAQANETHSSE
jgi:hypothetical protein